MTKAIIFAFVVLVVAACGWELLFRTESVVAKHRRNRNKGIVLKSWYPTWIRLQGLFLWIWVVCILYAVIFLHLR